MTKKDYVLIARVLRECADTAVGKGIAKRMAEELKRDNGAFRRDTFLSACGVE